MSDTTMQIVALGNENTWNSLEQPENIQVVPSTAVIENKTIKFSIPAFSVGVVKLTR